jgi:hypothetical protein
MFLFFVVPNSEDVVSDRHSFRWTTDSEPNSGVFSPHPARDVSETVVPPMAASLFAADGAEGQVEVVVYDEHPRGRDSERISEVPDGSARAIHVGHGQAESDGGVAKLTVPYKSTERGLEPRSADGREDLLDHREPDVVSGAGIGHTRVAQPDHHPHSLLGVPAEPHAEARLPTTV